MKYQIYANVTEVEKWDILPKRKTSEWKVSERCENIWRVSIVVFQFKHVRSEQDFRFKQDFTLPKKKE